MQAVYAFCRATDDLGDEGAPETRRARGWRPGARTSSAASAASRATRACARWRRPSPATTSTPEPFLRLVEANLMDQSHDRWATYDDLLGYCDHSATPVGRMVLGVLGYRDPWRVGMSDATCIGLQLANFWQDIRRDLDERGRVYLPLEDMDRFGVRARPTCAGRAPPPRVRALIGLRGRPGPRTGWTAGRRWRGVVPRRAGLDLRMFTAGGRAVCDAIARQGYDTLAAPPGPGTHRPRAHRRLGAVARSRGGTRDHRSRPTSAAARSPAAEARNFYYGFVLLPAPAPRGHLRRLRLQPPLRRQRGRRRAARRSSWPALEPPPRGARRAATPGDPPADDAVLVALADASGASPSRASTWTHLLEGVEWDLTGRRYADFAGAQGYCDRVAGAVGLVSLHVFGFTDPAAPAHARDLGVALQLVNIMRDVAEDAERGRIYLPARTRWRPTG